MRRGAQVVRGGVQKRDPDIGTDQTLVAEWLGVRLRRYVESEP